ncbi:MAG: hypothetical protein RSB76_02440 [Clostridia bacterium]
MARNCLLPDKELLFLLNSQSSKIAKSINCKSFTDIEYRNVLAYLLGDIDPLQLTGSEIKKFFEVYKSLSFDGIIDFEEKYKAIEKSLKSCLVKFCPRLLPITIASMPGISVRAIRALNRKGFNYISQLDKIKYSELINNIYGIGALTLANIVRSVHDYNIENPNFKVHLINDIQF